MKTLAFVREIIENGLLTEPLLLTVANQLCRLTGFPSEYHLRIKQSSSGPKLTLESRALW